MKSQSVIEFLERNEVQIKLLNDRDNLVQAVEELKLRVGVLENARDYGNSNSGHTLDVRNSSCDTRLMD